jgi:hypothetical protein
MKMNFPCNGGAWARPRVRETVTFHSRLICGLGRLSGGGDVQPGAVRAIEYEIMDMGQAARIGLGGASLAAELRATPELGVLRCVDHQGNKLTLVGQARHIRNLVASGKASDPDGMTLNEKSFPVVVNGWLISN